MSERFRNLPTIKQTDSARDGIWTTMYVSTKEVQAQVNERPCGWNFESKGQKEEKKDMHSNPSGTVGGVVTATVVIIVAVFWSVLKYVPFILEKEMATHSSTLAWKIPWMEKPGRQQSMGSQRVRYDWATSLSLSKVCAFYFGRDKKLGAMSPGFHWVESKLDSCEY